MIRTTDSSIRFVKKIVSYNEIPRGIFWKKIFMGTILDSKDVPPCNHLDTGVLRLPNLTWNQAGD